MENIKYICKFCGSERKNLNSLKNHERLCKENPNRQELHTHTEKWFAAMHATRGHATNQYTKAKELGLPPPDVSEATRKKISEKSKGRLHTEETKKRISESMKKIYKGKSIWSTQIEKRKSFAEEYFDNLFPELEKNYHVDRYYLDLANPNLKVYIEIDGEQHYNDKKVIEHDKERTLRLEELGWVCLKRVRWSEYKKLSKEEKETLIESLRKCAVGGAVTITVS